MDSPVLAVLRLRILSLPDFDPEPALSELVVNSPDKELRQMKHQLPAVKFNHVVTESARAPAAVKDNLVPLFSILGLEFNWFQILVIIGFYGKADILASLPAGADKIRHARSGNFKPDIQSSFVFVRFHFESSLRPSARGMPR